jgi:hypothetical protein
MLPQACATAAAGLLLLLLLLLLAPFPPFRDTTAPRLNLAGKSGALVFFLSAE